MSKELPYFKFYVNEWITGTISLEDFSTQGLFIDLCSYYWSRKGDISHKMLLKKYPNNSQSLDDLIESGVVIIDNGMVRIDFLDEQMEEYCIVSARNSINGSKGGRPPKTQNKPTPFISETKNEPTINLIRGEEKKEDEMKEDEIIVDIKFDFKKSLIDYGFDCTLVSEWLKIRKFKKNVNSETAYNGFVKEVERNSILTHNEILKICVERSWSGFKNEWLTNYNKDGNTKSNDGSGLIAWVKGD